MHDSREATSKIIAPPPVLYIGTLLIGFVLHAAFPHPILLSDSLLRVLGVTLLLISATFARWAFATMQRSGTSASPRKASIPLATGGPFRLSRNPIYLAMTGLYLGIAFVGNSWWPLLLLAPLLILMHYGVVLREERYLEKQFGEIYLAYKSSSRRWL